MPTDSFFNRLLGSNWHYSGSWGKLFPGGDRGLGSVSSVSDALNVEYGPDGKLHPTPPAPPENNSGFNGK